MACFKTLTIHTINDLDNAHIEPSNDWIISSRNHTINPQEWMLLRKVRILKLTTTVGQVWYYQIKKNCDKVGINQIMEQKKGLIFQFADIEVPAQIASGAPRKLKKNPVILDKVYRPIINDLTYTIKLVRLRHIIDYKKNLVLKNHLFSVLKSGEFSARLRNNEKFLMIENKPYNKYNSFFFTQYEEILFSQSNYRIR